MCKCVIIIKKLHNRNAINIKKNLIMSKKKENIDGKRNFSITIMVTLMIMMMMMLLLMRRIFDGDVGVGDIYKYKQQ